ncbi:hypothetical protein J437_LFUL011840 [Ladona fulva]|uniref:DNA-directed DNA polymerase n=1 Tax=Ladona fulva TaxID=123851 RepID=A0A8K0K412_LADFU|nr:hypothetical protein J437_LFUL011840 [Ladona fulva]
MKQEASGYPSWCLSEDQKARYIKDFFERERIELDAGNIAHNPGMRQLAKLMLNSFWGRFGMQENLTRCSILRTMEELLALITDPSVALSHLIPVNEDAIYASWNEREES